MGSKTLFAVAAALASTALTGCLGKGLDLGPEYNSSLSKPMPPTHIPGLLLGFNADHLIGSLSENSALQTGQRLSIPYGRAAQTGATLLVSTPSGQNYVSFEVERTSGAAWPISGLVNRGAAEITLSGGGGGDFDKTFESRMLTELDIYYLGGMRDGSGMAPGTYYPFFVFETGAQSGIATQLLIRDTDGGNVSTQPALVSLGAGHNISNVPTYSSTSLTPSPTIGLTTQLFNFGLTAMACSGGNYYNGTPFFGTLGFLPWALGDTQMQIGSQYTSSSACMYGEANPGTPIFGINGITKVGSTAFPVNTSSELRELFIFDHKLTSAERAEMQQYFMLKYYGVSDHQ